MKRKENKRMNKCLFTGGLTADAKINEGGTVAQFNLGVGRNFKNKEGKYESDYIPCKLYGEKAVTAFREGLVKGAQFEIEGRYANENYEKDGKTVYGHAIVVDRLKRIGGTRNNGTAPAAEEPAASNGGNDGFVNVEIDDSELPWN